MLIKKTFTLITRNTIIVLLVLLVTSLSKAPASEEDPLLTEHYAQTSWPTMHRDSCNSNFVPFDGPDSFTINWTALDKIRVLCSVTIGPEGNRYVTTGIGSRRFHLNALDQDGGLIWRTNSLDNRAAYSSIVVDEYGHIYGGDSEDLFAFYSNGTLKWSVPISDTIYTAAITVDGYLVVITENGEVMALNRDDGSLAAEIFTLAPGPVGQVINTPAIHPVSNRIYAVTGGVDAEFGYLYGIDFEEGSFREAFKTMIGANSRTSPAISHDGFHIYLADRDFLYAFDTEGRLEWTFDILTSIGSPSVGPPSPEAPNGVVYFLEGFTLGNLIAIADMGGNAEVLWETKYKFAAFINEYLPEVGYTRLAKANSLVAVATNYLYVAATFGYLFPYEERVYSIPHRTFVFTMGLDGSIIGEPVEVREGCEGVLSVADDGSIYVTHAAVSSSIAYRLNNVLPPQLRVPKPLGGITALQPTSSLNLAKKRINSGKELGKEALSLMDSEELEKASDLIAQGELQLNAVFAIALDEIDSKTAKKVQQHVDVAYKHFSNAKKHLYDGNVKPAMQLIENADEELKKALSLISK